MATWVVNWKGRAALESIAWNLCDPLYGNLGSRSERLRRRIRQLDSALQEGNPRHTSLHQ
jgi:hypothetical protein